MTRRVAAIGATSVVMVFVAWLVRVNLPATPRADVSTSTSPTSTSTPTPTSTSTSTPATAFGGSLARPSASVATSPSTSPSPKPALVLGSPRQTIATQQRLLESRDDEAFRSTFLPEVRAELTSEAIESCRKRLVGKVLKPDWEVAEETNEPGEAGTHRVVRVSIFGKSMTGFHEVAPDVWLADAAWCVPVF